MKPTVPTTSVAINPAAAKDGRSYGRLGGLDVLRIVSALAVVCIHVPETTQIQAWSVYCRFGVPAFTAMSILLLTLSVRQKIGQQPIGLFAWRRFVRLYTLFFFWNLVYLLARVLKKTFVAGGDALRFSPGTIFLSSFAEHLWYLSFIALFSGIMISGVLFFLRLNKADAFLFALAMFLAGGLAWIALHHLPVDLDRWPSSYFVSLSVGTLPAGMAGLLLAWLWLYPCGQKGSAAACGLSAAAAVVCLWMGREGEWASLLHDSAGICLVFSALTAPLENERRWIGAIASMALPVYCVHVLIVETFQAFAHKFRLGKTIELDAATFTVAVLGSGLFAWLLQRPWRNTWLAALHR